MAKISIYVANHRSDVEIIQSDIYRPMHVGRMAPKVDLSQIIVDDTGDNEERALWSVLRSAIRYFRAA